MAEPTVGFDDQCEGLTHRSNPKSISAVVGLTHPFAYPHNLRPYCF